MSNLILTFRSVKYEVRNLFVLQFLLYIFVVQIRRFMHNYMSNIYNSLLIWEKPN